jgi:hypothetical protein
MSRTTLLVLAALVVLLGLAAWRQLRLEEREKKAADVPLFEGVDPARVTRILVENLVRDQHMVFERDGRGRWRMSEPTSVPADQGMVQHLFESALDRHGTPVPEAEARPRDLGLDPPRAIVEIEEDLGGSVRRSRVDLGAVDLDGAHLNVRAHGLLLRTWRDLDTTLDRVVEDFMSHDAVDIAPHEVVEVHRRGSLARERDAPPADLTLDALLEDGIWRATAPVSAPLDPQAASLYVQGVAALRVKSYADFGRRLLADYGLDPAEMTLSLSTLSNEVRTLRFGRPGHAVGRAWHCTLEGQPFVWIVEDHAAELFAAPIEEFLDQSLTRLPMQAIDGVSLVLEGRELRLWREKDAGRAGSAWKVAERSTPEAAFTPGVPADRGKVEDLLGKIGRAEIAKFLAGEALSPGEVRGSLAVQAGEERQGGSLGAEVGSPKSGRAVRYQRTGDSVAGLVDPALLELFRTPVGELSSLLLLDLPELEQSELTLSRGEVHKRYLHGSKGLWTPPGVEIEARELRDVLDALTIVRVARHLGAGEHAALSDPVAVEFKSLVGVKVSYTVGVAAEAAEGERVQIDTGGRRAVLKDQGLHKRLLLVLEKR